MNYVTDTMEDGLRELQRVKTFDYPAAYRAAFGGGHSLRPAKRTTDAQWFEGRCLALSLITRLWLQHSGAASAALVVVVACAASWGT